MNSVLECSSKNITEIADLNCDFASFTCDGSVPTTSGAAGFQQTAGLAGVMAGVAMLGVAGLFM
jgi:hypothetical protein